MKKRNRTPQEEILDVVQSKLSAGSNTIGYRAMYQRWQQNGVCATREEVRLCLLELDPDGVLQRTRRRFHRRTYHCRGPNQVRHIDGCDKLKPYGFAVHGAIDGYSQGRQLLPKSGGNGTGQMMWKHSL